MNSSNQLPTPLDVIAVGAHPDDVEIACGGDVGKAGSPGIPCRNHRLDRRRTDTEFAGSRDRLAEATAAASVLGVHERIQLDLPNRRLFDCFEHRVALAREFRRWRPELVIGFGDNTPMASPDHWQAMQITDAAIFYSRLTKWDQHFEDLPVHAISRQLYFRLAVEPDADSTQFPSLDR